MKQPLHKLLTTLASILGIISLAPAQCPPGQLEVQIDVTTDSWGYECYWELVPTGTPCGTPSPIFAGGNPNVGCTGGGIGLPGGGYANDTTITEGPWCLDSAQCYDILSTDDWGDGGTQFNVYANGIIIQSFTTIGAIETFTFCATAQCGINLTQTNQLCNGLCLGSATATPTGTAPFTYTWSNGDTTAATDSLCTATHTLTLTDSTGCTATGSATITQPPPLTATATILSNPSAPGACDAELTFSATGGTTPYTYQWYDCAHDTLVWWPTMPPPPWYFCAGQWGVIAVDGNGCADTSCITVSDPTGIAEPISQPTIEIFPNPFSETTTITLEEIRLPTTLTICDNLGRAVRKETITQSTRTIHRQNLSNGIYYYRIANHSGKLIITQ